MQDHGWIVEVLEDILRYAQRQGLHSTPKELAQVISRIQDEVGTAPIRVVDYSQDA